MSPDATRVAENWGQCLERLFAETLGLRSTGLALVCRCVFKLPLSLRAVRARALTIHPRERMDHAYASSGVESGLALWSWPRRAQGGLAFVAYVAVLGPFLVAYALLHTTLDAVAAVARLLKKPSSKPLPAETDQRPALVFPGTCTYARGADVYDASRRRRGRDADSPQRRVAGRDADIPRRRATRIRHRRDRRAGTSPTRFSW